MSNVPNELFERIISEIDLTSDLLHFALVSKSLKNIIIPYHIQLRRIRCHVFHSDVRKIVAAQLGLVT